MDVDTGYSAAVGFIVTLTASWQKIFSGDRGRILDIALPIPGRAGCRMTTFGSAKNST